MKNPCADVYERPKQDAEMWIMEHNIHMRGTREGILWMQKVLDHYHETAPQTRRSAEVDMSKHD